MAKWTKGQIEQLKKSYVEYNVPSDQLLKDAANLDRFVTSFNSSFGGNATFEPSEVANQLLKLRKGAKLPRIRR